MDSPVPSDEAVRAQLERICGSSGFERSPRLRRFLNYLVEESRAGRDEALKEYAIGVEVFDRGDAFDPRLDPIVRVEARRLRAKLAAYYGAAGSNDPIRIDVPTGAYEAVIGRPTAPAAPDAAPSDATVPAIETPEPAPLREAAAGRRLVAITSGALVMALLFGAGWWRLRRSAPARTPSPPAAATPREAVSVAVLPLVPIGDDPLLAVFSDGLTEDIITQLARLRGLRVIARTSVNRFRQTQAPIRTIARDLGVQAVLEGSVRRDRGRLRITAQLIDGSSERHLWAQSYDRSFANTLAIQSDVAREVTQALAVHLSADDERRLAQSSTSSEAAHEAYLRGMHHMSLRTPAEVQKGVGWLEKAVALDPAYGAARATLGETYLFLAIEGAAPPALLEKTRVLASTALQQSPNLAEGHRALGLVHVFRDHDWAAAERRLRTALELGPGMYPNHEALAAALLLPLGRLDEAVAAQRAGCALSPLSASAVALLGRLVDLAGQEAEGVRLLESAIDLEPRFARAYVQLGKLHLSHGRTAEAARLLQRSAELAPDALSGIGALAVAYARLGRREDAEAIDRQLAVRSAAGSATAISRAEVAMGLGDADAAMLWLERAASAREPRVVYLAADPLYEPLRSDARFASLLRRLGLQPSRS